MDYYIGPNGELYHGLFGKGKGKPRDGHKYIKREWKNGRWQYTYKQDAKTAGKIRENAKVSSGQKQNRANNDLTGAKAEQRYTKAQEKYRNITNRINEKLMSNIHYREASYGRGTEYVSKNDRAARAKAVEEYARDKAEQKRAKNELDSAKKAYEQTTRYKLKNIPSMLRSMTEGIKQKTSDVLGYDEKAYRDYAKKQSETVTDPATLIVNGKATQVDWEKEYADAQKEYMKTPLGLLETTGRAIDKLGERASDTLNDVGKGLKELYDDVAFEVSFAVEEAADWVDDRLDDLHDATIGEVKDSLGYDERARVSQAAQSRKRDLEPLIGSVKNITQDQKRLSSDDKNSDAKADIENIDIYWFEENYVDYVSSSAAYIRAKKQYSETALGKIDQWVNGTSENHNDVYQQWQLYDHGFYDAEQVRQEAKLAANWVRRDVARDSYREAQRDMLAYKDRLDELNKNSRANRDEIERYARLHSEAKQATNSAKRVYTTLDEEVKKLYSEYHKSYPSAIDDPDARLYQILDVLGY